MGVHKKLETVIWAINELSCMVAIQDEIQLLSCFTTEDTHPETVLGRLINGTVDLTEGLAIASAQDTNFVLNLHKVMDLEYLNELSSMHLSIRKALDFQGHDRMLLQCFTQYDVKFWIYRRPGINQPGVLSNGNVSATHDYRFHGKTDSAVFRANDDDQPDGLNQGDITHNVICIKVIIMEETAKVLGSSDHLYSIYNE